MTKIINFIANHEEAKISILECLDYFFNEETLILNDTRLLIIPEILPHIPFVGWYDQRILPILKNTTVIFSKPFSETTHQYYNNLGLSTNVEVLQIENNHAISLTGNILWNPELIQNLKSVWYKTLINFAIDPKVEKLATIIGAKTLVTSEISELANNKLKLKQFLEKEWLPTIDGIYTNKSEIIEEYVNKNEHYFFKDPLGVSGYWF